MRIGDSVSYTGFASIEYDKRYKRWVPVQCEESQGVYIGHTWRMNGRYYPATRRLTTPYGDFEGEQAFLEVDESVKLYVVQPVDNTGRWRKPELCFPEQVTSAEDGE